MDISKLKKFGENVAAIRLAVKTDADLEDMIEIAIVIARHFQVDVSFTFNNVNLTVNRESDAEHVKEKYLEILEEKNEIPY